MTNPLADRRMPVIALFAAASVVVVGAGCWTAHQAGVATAVWGRIMAAWGTGLAIAIILSRVNWTGGVAKQRRAAIGVAAIALLLSLCFADAGLQGVHRWIVIGPLRLNVAALFLPLAVVLVASLSLRMQITAAAVMMALLIAEPDASQATAFGISAGWLIWSRGAGWASAVALAMVAILVAAACLRPDPLAPVPEVEGIVALTWAQSPLLAIAAITGLAVAVLAPFAASGITKRDPAALALTAYMAVTAITPAIGAFPVPLMGMSISPIIGFWIGIGELARRRNAQ